MRGPRVGQVSFLFASRLHQFQETLAKVAFQNLKQNSLKVKLEKRTSMLLRPSIPSKRQSRTKTSKTSWKKSLEMNRDTKIEKSTGQALSIRCRLHILTLTNTIRLCKTVSTTTIICSSSSVRIRQTRKRALLKWTQLRSDLEFPPRSSKRKILIWLANLS